MSKFFHDNDADNDNNDDATAIAIPRVFSENSRAKNVIETVHCIMQCQTLNQVRKQEIDDGKADLKVNDM